MNKAKSIYYFFLILLIGFLLSSCFQKREPQLIDVKIAVANQPTSALFFIAIQQEFFKEQGLNAIISYHDSGKRALIDSLLKGLSDFASTADVPVIWQSFKHPDLKILATIYTTDNNNRIIARKDAGITTLTDLQDKKIATQQNSAVHYFLQSVLEESKIPRHRVEFSFYPAAQLPQKLADAQIDAFSMREPYISQASQLLGAENVTIFSAPGLYMQSEFLVSQQTYLEQHPDIAKAVLQALIKAEQFYREQPEKTLAILTDALKSDSNKLKDIIGSAMLQLGLEHSLLPRLEHIIRWMHQEKITPEGKEIELDKLLYPKLLQQIKPEAMLLIQ